MPHIRLHLNTVDKISVKGSTLYVLMCHTKAPKLALGYITTLTITAHCKPETKCCEELFLPYSFIQTNKRNVGNILGK